MKIHNTIKIVLFFFGIMVSNLNAQNIPETEPNNHKDDSGVITINYQGTLTGSLLDGNGADYWKIPYGTSGSLTLNFSISPFCFCPLEVSANSDGYADHGTYIQNAIYDGSQVTITLDPTVYYSVYLENDGAPGLVNQNHQARSASSSYSIALSGSALPLPVELTEFRLEKEDVSSKLHWQTASETNNAHFQIQHSLDGRDFIEIGQVEGMGTTNEETNYEFLHENPANGINYYRLKQVDFDGSFSYSEIISIQMESDENKPPLVFFPNPVQKELTLINDSNEPLELTILNASGQEVFYVKMEESTEMIYSVVDLSAGIYWIKTVQNEAVTTAKFMKLE